MVQMIHFGQIYDHSFIRRRHNLVGELLNFLRRDIVAEFFSISVVDNGSSVIIRSSCRPVSKTWNRFGFALQAFIMNR